MMSNDEPLVSPKCVTLFVLHSSHPTDSRKTGTPRSSNSYSTSSLFHGSGYKSARANRSAMKPWCAASRLIENLASGARMLSTTRDGTRMENATRGVGVIAIEENDEIVAPCSWPVSGNVHETTATCCAVRRNNARSGSVEANDRGGEGMLVDMARESATRASGSREVDATQCSTDI